MFERIVTALETAVLGLWAGAMAGFAFVFAPIAIHVVPRMDVFASLIAATIAGIGTFGTVLGATAIVAALLRLATATRGTSRGARPAVGVRRLALARIALVLVALGAGAYETRVVIPNMTSTAARIFGPIDSVAKTDPRRAAYDRQHAVSSRVYGTAFLCVAGALVLAPFGRRRRVA